jgi:hypothetical protein
MRRRLQDIPNIAVYDSRPESQRGEQRREMMWKQSVVVIEKPDIASAGGS